MKCLHRRVQVSEKANYHVCADIEGGAQVFAFDTDPTPTGAGEVQCRDCGQTYKYGWSRRGRARLPRWVVEAIYVFEGD